MTDSELRDDRPEGTSRSAPIVRMRGIDKRFPGVVALAEVDFDLEAGEVHALAGENGSGKSTLAKILYGALTPDAGTVEVDGEERTISSPHDALRMGIVAISQELTLAPTLTVAENVLMGRLPRRRGVVDWRATQEQAQAALDELAVHIDPRIRVGDLSIELQQEVEVARAISARPRILILDEATSSLSEAATERLLERLAQLRDQGVAILFISHRMRELYACAQRATVLRDGRVVGTVPLPDTSEDRLVRMLVGREISDLFGKRRLDSGRTMLTVSRLSTADGTIREASFEVRSGEIVGVAGLVGSGKSELALALGGAVPSRGEVRVEGEPVSLRTPRQAIAAGICFVPEDRKRSALLPTRSVKQNLSIAWLRQLSRLGFIDLVAEWRQARAAVERFSVRTRSLETPIVHLSGGNQQKVVLGRWFDGSPRVVVLAEPTRGIDVRAKSEVYGFIQDMAEEGAAVLLVSSELPELLGITDRILVTYSGSIRAEFETSSTTEEEIAHAAFGGHVAAEAAPA